MEINILYYILYLSLNAHDIQLTKYIWIFTQCMDFFKIMDKHKLRN